MTSVRNAVKTTPVVTEMIVYSVAGRDSMLLNLSGSMVLISQGTLSF